VDLLKKYRDIVMPAARLAGYDDFAKWLFTIAAFIGSLGAAFSNAALKGLAGTGVMVFFLAIVATGISLALAVVQRSVDIPKVNWQSLEDMLEKTERTLRIKRAIALVAGASFAIAILLAGLAPLLSARRGAGNVFTYSYGKDGIRATVTLVESGTTESEIELLAQSPSSIILIGAQRAEADFNGVARLDLTSAPIPAGTTDVSVKIRCDAKTTKAQTFLIPLQRPSGSPSTPPPEVISCK
jgi:hypothetical protein